MARSRRGRLSSLDLLPDEARPHVLVAIEQLKLRERTQEDIREELNTHLLALGLNPVSKSAFNRKALQIAAYGEHLFHVREISAVMAEKLNDTPEGEIGLLLNEVIKSLVYELIMGASLSDEAVSSKMLKEAALTLSRLERARQISVETRSKIMRDFKDKAGEAIDKCARKAGLDDDTIAKIRREVLGVADA